MSDVLWRNRSLQEGKPTVHALVIGVSAYDHLPGGTAEPCDAAMLSGLKQLSAAATSATRVALWLRNSFDFPDVQLGSIRLLASPSPTEAPLPDDVTPPPATYDEVRRAVVGWLKDARSSEGNVTVLYVAGHGIQTSSEGGILLLQDVGAPDSLRVLERAIDVASVRVGMVADPNEPGTSTPPVQYYFYDACRVVPPAAAAYDELKAGVFLDIAKGTAPTTSYVLWASNAGDYALADPETKTTLFSGAFTDALESRAPVGPDGRTVRLAEFGVTLETLVAERAGEFGEEQNVTPGGSGPFTTPVYLRPAQRSPSRGAGAPGGGVLHDVVIRAATDTALAFTVLNERDTVVAAGLTGSTVHLPVGLYRVAVQLPWGGEGSADIEVAVDAVSLIVDVTMPRQDEGLAVALPRLDRQLGRIGVAADWSVRFLAARTVPAADTSPFVEVPPEDWPTMSVVDVGPDGVSIDVETQSPFIQYMQIRTAEGRSLVTALPIVQYAEMQSQCVVVVRVSEDAIGAVIRFADPLKDTIGGYLAGGRADHVVSLVPSAEQMLMSKMRDPLGAALGGYALLRLNALDRLHDWPENLARMFDWLPDGSVIAAELAARQGRDEAAANHLLTAVARGIPVFSDGLSLFASRAPQLFADDDVAPGTKTALIKAAAPILAISAAAQFRALTTTLMVDPAIPGGTDPSAWLTFNPSNTSGSQADYWRP